MAGGGSSDSVSSKNIPLATNAQGANLYIPSLATSSLKEFYDDVVYWEIAKGTNKFFVTFERGMYAFQNNKQESIATMEIDFPHLNKNVGDTGFIASQSTGGTRNQVGYDSFLQEDELAESPYQHQGYNGFITITSLKGTRFFQSTITSSISKSVTGSYEISSSTTTVVTRSCMASYFYPFSSHQLSVLRKSPTIIIDLDKDNELDGYVAENGFAVIPFQTHKKIKDNFEYYLEKAGMIEKTTKNKAPKKGI